MVLDRSVIRLCRRLTGLAMAAGGYAQTMPDHSTGSSASVDPGAFLAAADRLADRFRSMPQSRLTALAPAGLLLAGRLTRRAQELEGGPARPELPEPGIFVVGDQIALTAHDLASAVARAATGAAADDDAEALSTALSAVLAEASGEVEELYRLATTRSARM